MQSTRRDDDGSKTGTDSSFDISSQMGALKVVSMVEGSNELVDGTSRMLEAWSNVSQRTTYAVADSSEWQDCPRLTVIGTRFQIDPVFQKYPEKQQLLYTKR